MKIWESVMRYADPVEREIAMRDAEAEDIRKADRYYSVRSQWYCFRLWQKPDGVVPKETEMKQKQ